MLLNYHFAEDFHQASGDSGTSRAEAPEGTERRPRWSPPCREARDEEETEASEALLEVKNKS